MLYELRTYSAMPGRLPDLNRRFADITMGFFKNGPLVRRLTAQILRPTAYSPMQ